MSPRGDCLHVRHGYVRSSGARHAANTFARTGFRVNLTPPSHLSHPGRGSTMAIVRIIWPSLGECSRTLRTSRTHERLRWDYARAPLPATVACAVCRPRDDSSVTPDESITSGAVGLIPGHRDLGHRTVPIAPGAVTHPRGRGPEGMASNRPMMPLTAMRTIQLKPTGLLRTSRCLSDLERSREPARTRVHYKYHSHLVIRKWSPVPQVVASNMLDRDRPWKHRRDRL